MEKYNLGTVSSHGIGIGTAYCIKSIEAPILSKIAEGQVDSEIKRLLEARAQTVVQLKALIVATEQQFGKAHAELFEAHLTLFEDDEFEHDIVKKIKQSLYNAPYAVEEFVNDTCAELMQLDEYFQERASDIRDLGRRLIACLEGKEYNNYKNIKDGSIIVANDITPSMTAQIDTSKIAGFITETGGVTSHVSFIAQNLGIPAIVGAKNILEKIKVGDELVLDAIDGAIIHKPDAATKTEYEARREAHLREMQSLLKNVNEPATTIDGTNITLLANIGGYEDVAAVIKNGGEGVGLFRTEFLFMGDVPPSEEKQFDIYRKVLVELSGKPVTIRTLDIGGDKQIPFLNLPKEENPFLGYRALRIYADHVKIIGEQIRAILRASAFGSVRIMIPMVISINEVVWIKKFIKGIEQDLIKEGHTVGQYFVGIMVETPSVAVLSDLFIKEVDFFSIGTNDLVQYTLAVDRGNETIASLYQPFHPAIVRLLQKTISSANEVGKSVSVCGDMGGNEYAVLMLMGLGLTKISMSPSRIPIIKNMICKIDMRKLSKEIHKLNNVGTIEEVRSMLERIFKKISS